MNNIMKKMAEEKERERKRWECIRQVALDRGLVLVQQSPRRHLVIRLNTASSCVSNYSGKYITYLSGSIAHGPADFRSCYAYINDNVEELPKELRG